MIQFPPIRQLLQPDPGWVLIDCDFERSDAQIVAWEADEPELKAIFQRGDDIHTQNAEWMWNQSNPVRRQAMKAGIHLTDYGGRERTLAMTLGVPVARAAAFQAWWFGRFPGIRRWHQQVELDLRLRHHIRNVWGFRRWYFDLRPRNIEQSVRSILPQALAWVGQSGVAGAINHAMLQVRARFDRRDLRLVLPAQNHDSLLMQARAELVPAIFPAIVAAMRVEIPYPDPLVIPVTLKWSAENWGSMQRWLPPSSLDRAA